MKPTGNPSRGIEVRGLLWMIGVLGRSLLRRGAFRGLLAIYLGLLVWWAWAVPAGSAAVADAPWLPWGWPRWLVYGCVLTAPWLAPSRRAHELHPGQRSPGLASWFCMRLMIELWTALFLGHLALVVASWFEPGTFHVEPRHVVIHAVLMLAVAGAVALALHITSSGPARAAVCALFLVGFELLLQQATATPEQTVLGITGTCLGLVVLVDLKGRKRCVSQS